uniref:Endonuclease/exonuclease/phosphatase domain-containing protein n=1 Tax=Auxenochlorella protothecoides TaxID=3075 RepID=A0A1D2ACA3_AUXPR
MESACLTRPGASPQLAKPWYARGFVPCSPLRTEEVPCLPGRALKVVTYNILADCLTTRMRSEYDAAVLDPVRRVALLMAGLQALDADLYFLQEVEEGLMETLREMMSGHEVHCSLADALHSGKRVGICLLWRCARLQPLASLEQRLDAVVLEPGDTAPFALRARALDETVLVKRFLDLETGRAFCAAVTHLYYHPRHPDLKVLQAHAACAAVRAFASAQGGPQPLLLAGDFNSLAEKRVSDEFDEVPEGCIKVSGVYELLSQGRVAHSNSDHPASRNSPAELGRLRDVSCEALECPGKGSWIGNGSRLYGSSPWLHLHFARLAGTLGVVHGINTWWGCMGRGASGKGVRVASPVTLEPSIGHRAGREHRKGEAMCTPHGAGGVDQHRAEPGKRGGEGLGAGAKLHQPHTLLHGVPGLRLAEPRGLAGGRRHGHARRLRGRGAQPGDTWIRAAAQCHGTL